MENEEFLTSTLDELDEKIRSAENGEEAKQYAEAYKTMLEADTLEYRETAKLDTEVKKARLGFFGALIAGIATVGAVILRILGELKYQDNAQKYEDEGAYINYKKHKTQIKEK